MRVTLTINKVLSYLVLFEQQFISCSHFSTFFLLKSPFQSHCFQILLFCRRYIAFHLADSQIFLTFLHFLNHVHIICKFPTIKPHSMNRDALFVNVSRPTYPWLIEHINLQMTSLLWSTFDTRKRLHLYCRLNCSCSSTHLTV